MQLAEVEADREEVKGMLSTAANRCGKAAESLEAKESQATAKKHELNKIARENNAKLKESVEKLKGTGEARSQIQKTIECLEVTLRTLGKVKATFSLVQLFWSAMAKRCQMLAEMKNILKDDLDIICDEKTGELLEGEDP